MSTYIITEQFFKKSIFFKTKDTTMLLFLLQYITLKTDNIRYYLL